MRSARRTSTSTRSVTPSVLCIAINGRYFGVTVDTMPTPMNSIAMMQTAISQCSRR
jgi:hypothetical protein